jgi:hypothetical protein
VSRNQKRVPSRKISNCPVIFEGLSLELWQRPQPAFVPAISSSKSLQHHSSSTQPPPLECCCLNNIIDDTATGQKRVSSGRKPRQRRRSRPCGQPKFLPEPISAVSTPAAFAVLPVPAAPEAGARMSMATSQTNTTIPTVATIRSGRSSPSLPTPFLPVRCRDSSPRHRSGGECRHMEAYGIARVCSALSSGVLSAFLYKAF